MNYKLFDDFITLQAILKELGIIQSGGAIKAFLQEKEVFVNGESEQRRGRKLRVNDQIDIPELSITITILEPSQEEIEEHLKDKEEKERVAKLVKQLNQQQKKQPKKSNKKEKAIRCPLPLEISLTPKGRITKVNHLKQAKLSNYIGHMNVVLFAPEDLQLIKGSPAGRRKFIDIELGQMKPLYLSDLSQYNHVLKQRNSYLKNSEKIDATFLDN